MAKQRKQKQRDGKGDAAAAAGPSVTLRHQKLCLAIDMHRRRLEGHTELTVACTKGSVIGLSARGLRLERLLVDDKPAKFELVQQNDAAAAAVEQGEVLTPAQAADVAYAKYLALLQAETVPDVLIHPAEARAGPAPGPRAEPSSGGAVGEAAAEAPAPPAPGEGDATEEVKVVRVEYWVEEPELGAYFAGDTMHVNTQQRHARWWFPCMDSPSQRCSYDMEFTVDANYLVVSCGELLRQVPSAENPGLKTFVYHLGIPTAANFISVVVAPLEEIPDRHNSSILHYCMPGGDNMAKLECTISEFHSVFSWFEEYVGASFPYAYYKHVFINTESAVSSVCVSASMTILSSYLLFNENILDQAVETRLRLASALAQQWFGVYITPEAPSDAWLLEGLAGFLLDLYVKRTFGNNDACYRQHKANEAVCRVDIDNVPPLSLSASSGMDLYGTEKYGSLGKIRAFKSFAIVQMLEKQMGPDSFRKILQRIIIRTQEDNSSKDTKDARTLSTKEFRHFAMKIGNLERPFLKDFFPRWVESQGCPILRLGYSYNKRRNMVELAVQRDSTASSDTPRVGKDETDDGSLKNMHTGWPGMMSVRIHELDGMYDHPSLPMAGDPYQLLELQCHSKLAGRRVPRPKKGSKADPNEDVVEIATQNLESPLLWLRADPGMEYLAEIHLYQSEQMWINQLERERDVAGQVLAINELRALPRPSFAVVTALSNCLNDSKVFCRVRIEAASALASTATETTNWAGLSHLIKFYKNSCFDIDLGLPKPNDFQDVAEYFVLQAIPGSVAAVRGSDGKSPPEAAEFVLHILKHNDNSGNMFSDVFWLASVIESVGNFAFGQQTTKILCKILKQIDHYLQYDRIVSSFNGLLTTSCIRTLTKLSLKLPDPTSTSKMQQILLPLKDAASTEQKVRVAALRALLDIECLWKGYDAAVRLAMDFVAAEPSLRVQSKVFSHLFRTAFVRKPTSVVDVTGPTLIGILRFLDSHAALRNVQLRHDTFGLLQVLAGRPATLYRLDTLAGVQAQKADDTPAPARIVITPQVRPMKPRDLSKPVPADSPVTPMATLRLEPPRRIRLVNNMRPGISKEAESTPTHSASSSGGPRQIDDKRTVGKVKLRLKPSLDVINQVEAALNRSPPLAVGTSPVPDEAHSQLAGGRSEHSMPAEVIDEGRPVDTKTKEEEDFQSGQGLMRLLTDDSPVRRESVGGFGSGPAGDLHGAQVFREEAGGSELELGEIPSDKPDEVAGVGQLQSSSCPTPFQLGPADLPQGNEAVPCSETSAPTGEKSHRKEKERKEKKEKKEKKDKKEKKEKRDKKEKKDKESKLKQDERDGEDKEDKHDKKHKHKRKRKHQKEEVVANDGAGKADKKRKREEEEGDDGKKHRSEKKKLKPTDLVSTPQGAQGPSDAGGMVGSVSAGTKSTPSPLDTGGESNKGNPDGILRLRIKKF